MPDLQEIDIGLYPLPDEEWVLGKSGGNSFVGPERPGIEHEPRPVAAGDAVAHEHGEDRSAKLRIVIRCPFRARPAMYGMTCD